MNRPQLQQLGHRLIRIETALNQILDELRGQLPETDTKDGSIRPTPSLNEMFLELNTIANRIETRSEELYKSIVVKEEQEAPMPNTIAGGKVDAYTR